MKRIVSRKIALALCFFMVFSCVAPCQVAKKNTAKAATKTIETVVGSYAYISYSGLKAGAKYSCSFSNSKIARVVRGSVSQNKKKRDELYLNLEPLKVGTTTAKLKQTYKKKTKIVAKYKLKVAAQTVSNSYCYFPTYYLPTKEFERTEQTADGGTITTKMTENYLQIEKGVSLPLSAILYTKGSFTCVSEDPAVVEVANGVVTAKAVGETYLVAKQGDNEQKLRFVVSEPVNSAVVAKAKELGSKLDALYAKKVTTKNVISLFNTYVTYSNELIKLSNTEIYASKRYDETTKTFLYYSKYSPDKFADKYYNVAKKKASILTVAGASLEGVKIKSVTTKKVKMSWKKPINQYDILVGCLDTTKKITKNSVMGYTACFTGDDRYYIGTLKVGKKSGTLSALKDAKVKKGTASYCLTDKKGNVTYNKIKVK